ncbi:acyltransferase [Agriterribacter sp.]|uniref:acyltransferase family protein n=1 Tax=Agriterribacter sp. TaxID=2821509 RepID=UPI002C06A977|nr:acyltransferase [Agriterribacter sp.]HRO47785.1 acyltransferase [Agriterribacter sp.]
MTGLSTDVSKTSNNVTLLRHFAAIFVLISHSFDLLNRSAAEPLSLLSGGATSLSRIGLIFFFFISGLLITQSLYNSAGITHFLWKRVLRIYPALIVLIFLTVFILGPVFTAMPIGAYFKNGQTWEYFFGGISLIRLRFFLPGVFDEHGVNGSLWSLPVEFRFYILLAVFFITGVLKKIKLYILFPGLFLFIYLASPYFSINPIWIYLAPYISWAGFFFLGSFVFFVRDKIKMNLAILLAVLVLWYFTRHIIIINKLTELIAFSYLTLFLSFSTPVLGKNFFSKNDFSYSTYIYAFPVQQILLHTGSDKVAPLELMILTLLVLIPFCWFSWHCIEKPALKLKNIMQ